MNEAIKKRLAELKRQLTQSDQAVTVVLPDGTREKRLAADWWEHRHEWPLADFDHQDNEGGLAVLLVFAKMFDDGAAEARASGDDPETERMEEERDAMLTLYFGERP